MSSSPLFSLPLELYRPIIQHIDDRQTLLNLLLTFSLFHYEAERCLYHSFSLASFRPKHHRDSQVGFFRRLTGCERVALFVRRIDIVHESGPHRIRDDDEEFQDLLPRALKAAINLKYLSFGSLGCLPAAHILRSCTFQLLGFNWYCHSDEHELRSFLMEQRELRELHVRWRESVDGPHHSALRRLDKFTGCYDAIKSFLPLRNVAHLHWVPDIDDEPQIESLSEMSAAMNRLTTLVFGGYFWTDFQVVANHITNLRFLELIGRHGDPVELMVHVPQLEGLTLSRAWGPRHSLYNIDACRDFVPRIYKCSPKLLFIDVHLETGWEDGVYNHTVYRRWDAVVIHNPLAMALILLLAVEPAAPAFYHEGLVLHHVNDRSTLLELMVTSSAMYPEAERRLYHAFDQKCYASDRELHAQLRILCIEHWHEPAERRKCHHAEDETYYGLFSSALEAMVNLENLSFGSACDVAFGRVLHGCTFQLHTLIWNSSHAEVDLARFLPKQAHLRYLGRLLWKQECPPLPSGALPNLRTIQGNYVAISALLPGRDIVYLHWVPYRDDPVPSVSLIAESLNRLTALVFGGRFWEDFRVVADLLQNLKYLELVGFQRDIPDLTSRIPQLEGLTLSRAWGPTMCLYDNDICMDLVPRLFSAGLCLRFVDVQFGSPNREGYSLQNYLRWTREGSSPRDVIHDEEIPWYRDFLLL
ncbi:hypothetical protein FISHEDRAFT_70878 [Fistulina hepatica ATCC 64428]|uniref:Uncharacterized protein n=1 Tax=Fistulina hepatica ATCC 64428 TaxID=1128425 RepID=A0A0D7AHB0_9AGAR|nr:hypothetical protein FISHEDRAFT_70878 [Fistulina hepatica ATCC 64428]